MATSKAGVEAVHKKWVDLEDSDEDEDFVWQIHILCQRHEEAVRQISQTVVETEETLEKAEEVLQEAMRDLEQAWDDIHGKELILKKVREWRREEINFMKRFFLFYNLDLFGGLPMTRAALIPPSR